MKGQTLEVAIKATFDVKDSVDGIKGIMDCIHDALERLREEGAAEGTLKIKGDIEVKL